MLPTVKAQIEALQGMQVHLSVTSGHNKIRKYTGVLESVYPSLFTVRVDEPCTVAMLSCSYNDLLCGHVKLLKLKKENESALS